MIIAKNAGFCQGVKNALNKTLENINNTRKIATYGPLVHNRQVIDKLLKRGVDIVNDVDEAEPGSYLIIRSHGAGPGVFLKAWEKNIKIIDATCPFVKKVQKKAREIYEKGYQLIIIGDPEHPEVKAINMWADETGIIINSRQMAKQVEIKNESAVVCQTTFQKGAFDRIIEDLRDKKPGIVAYETICDATLTRQEDTKLVAKQVDLMIVIGGYNSSNTKKLKKLSLNQGVTTYHIESADDLESQWFINCGKVGVTAGASTPDWLIKEVVNKMSENQNEEKNYYVEEKHENEENAFDEPQLEHEHKYDSLQEGVFKGQEVKGEIVEISETKAFVDIGHKTEAILPHSEVYTKPGESLLDILQVGDEIEATIIKVEPSAEEGEDEGANTIVLSKKQVDRERIWQWLNEVKENEEIVEAEVLEEVKGGLIVFLNGVRGFVPASLVERFYVPDLSQYIGKKLRLKVKELDRSRNKVLLSHKDVLDEEYEHKKKEVLDNIEPDTYLEGEVKRVTDFGAFIDIGGIDGLCHISEISYDRIDHPSDVLEVGANVNVKVLSVDKESEKIALSLKRAQPDPWETIPEKFEQGEIVEGKVTQTVNFGAFVELIPGVEGLVHISQLADYHVEKTEDVAEEGDTVKVKILDMDVENKRISLSIKEAKETAKQEGQKQKQQIDEGTEELSVEEAEEDDGSVKLGEVYGDLLKEIKKQEDDG